MRITVAIVAVAALLTFVGAAIFVITKSIRAPMTAREAESAIKIASEFEEELEVELGRPVDVYWSGFHGHIRLHVEIDLQSVDESRIDKVFTQFSGIHRAHEMSLHVTDIDRTGDVGP